MRKMRWRSAGGVCDQAGKASAAASIARCASARVPAGTLATTSPLNGSVSSNVLPPSASVHWPPMCRPRTVFSIALAVIAMLLLAGLGV